ncbi:MAG: SURF1 family protein [Burkholderiales bacterium]
MPTNNSHPRPRWLPPLAAAMVVALTAWAGSWQLGKAYDKEALKVAYDQAVVAAPLRLSGEPLLVEAINLKRIEARGNFVAGAMVLLDNKTRAGVAGYEVVMPLRIAGSSTHVLVNRGWIAAGRDRARLPDIRTPDVLVDVVGMARIPGRFFELAPVDEAATVWQNLTIERFVRARKIDVLPVLVEQSNSIDDGLQRSAMLPDFGIGKHYGYAVQWFALCALIIFLYLYFHVRKTQSG